MNPSPKISVIMSVYNGMPYLKEAVASILNQTYKNFEFIIVNDASTDESLKYLKSLKDKRIKLINNSKNLGLAASLNKGLKVAKGDYVARMDADDISSKNRFKEQIKFLQRNPSIDLCGTWANKIDENGQVIGQVKYPTKDKDIKKFLAWQPSVVHPTFMAKAQFYKALNGYNQGFDLAEEYELLIRAKNKFKFANIPKNLLHWRYWDQRRSRSSWDKMERVDFKIKMNAFKRADFGRLYVFVVISKFFITYILPYNIKLKIFKLFNMI